MAHTMSPFTRLHLRFRPSIAFVLLTVLMVALLVAGGASRADVLGQVAVRLCAWLLLIAGILLGVRPDWSRMRLPLILPKLQFWSKHGRHWLLRCH